MSIGTSVEAYDRYRDDPGFHGLVNKMLTVIDSGKGQYTVYEFREAMTVALEIHTVNTIQPCALIAPQQRKED